MKKSLLFAGTAMLCLSAYAGNQVYEDLQIKALSPNGKYAVSELYDAVALVNLETGELQRFLPDEAGLLAFSAGSGNCVANDGTFVGNYAMSSPATIFQNGDYITLPSQNSSAESHPNGITPDGRVICGTMATGRSAMEDATALQPCVWIKGEDGKYGMPVMLPYPELDFTGRAPQYVTAVVISDDGNTIAGQVLDYRGIFASPIVYNCNSEGEWSYTLVHPELQNPNNVVFPPYPGDGPIMPSQESYMTAQEKQAYEDAVNEYFAGNRDEWPVYEDFMTDEEIEAYEIAYSTWEEAQLKWEADFMAFENALVQCMEEGCSFVFNSIFMSSDGKILATTDRKQIIEGDNPELATVINHYTPYVFDLTTGTYEHNANDINHLVSSLADDGTLFTRDLNLEPEQTEVRLPDGTYTTFYDFVNSKNASVGAWVKENMYHDMEVYDPEAGGLIWQENVPVFGGLGRCTPDISRISTTTFNYWNVDSPVQFYAYIFDMDNTLSVDNISNIANVDATVIAGGIISLSGSVKALNVYDMQGRCVFSVENPANYVSTGLPKGLYVVKVSATDGREVSKKAAF